MTVSVRPFKGDKSGKVWEVDVKFAWPDETPFRKRMKSPVTSKTATRRWGEQKEQFFLAKGPSRSKEEEAEKKEVPTVEAFLPSYFRDHCMADRLKTSSIESKKQVLHNHLLPVVGKVKLDEVTLQQVQTIKGNMCSNGNSPSTVNNALSALNMILKKAAEWGVIGDVPCRITYLKRIQKESSYYEFEDYKALLDAARKLEPQYELLILLGGDAGLRLGEVAALRWQSVNFERNVLIIRGAPGMAL